MYWGKENDQAFEVLLARDSKLTLIPGHQKCHWRVPVRVRVYGGPVLYGVLASVCLTAGPMGPEAHLVVISSFLEGILGKDIPSNRQNLHIGFLACQMRALLVVKLKYRSLECLRYIYLSRLLL